MSLRKLRWLALLILGVAAALITLSVNPVSASAPYTEVSIALAPAEPGTVDLPEPHEESHAGHTEELFVSQVIESNFDLAGFAWSSGTVTSTWVQTLAPADGWSEWMLLGIHHDDGGRAGSDPIWAPGSIGFRVAFEGVPVSPIAGLVQRSEAGSRGLESPNDKPQTTNSMETADNPSSWIHPREDWDTEDCAPPEDHTHVADVQAVVIHHTTGADYAPEEVAEVIRGICLFHVNGRNWGDIGYNFLVDKYGGIWEGRRDSLDAPVSGAHAFGFNSRTQGVALIGNFQAATPPTAQRDALVQILDWLTGRYFLDPEGAAFLVSRSDGSLFGEGEGAWMPTIVGHRDLVSTSCPGNGAHSLLPTIRSLVQPVPIANPTSPGDELFVYSSDNGRHRFDSIEADGSFANAVSQGWQQLGWSVVEPIDLSGNNRDELLSYSTTTGAIAFDFLNADGRLGARIRTGQLGRGWTSVEPAETDGDDRSELFFYRITDGRFGFYQLRSDGMLGSAIRVGWFGAGWTSVEPIDIDGDQVDEMLFYRSDDGRLAVYDMSPDGLLGSPIHLGFIGAGWDVIEPLDLGGDGTTAFLFYRYRDGRYAAYRTGPTGAPTVLLGVGNYSDQWTSIGSPDLDE